MPANHESSVTFGRRAWHLEDNNLDANDPRRFSVAGTIEASGLDWEVEKYENQIANAPYIPEDIRGSGVLGSYTVVRKSDWQQLGQVGELYECLQNRDMFQWFQPFLDSGHVSFETAGSLDNGKIVWMLARCGEDVKIDAKSNDMIRKYLLLSSSHDGSQKTRIGFTPTRVVCWNTLSAAHGNGTLLSVRHTKSQSDSLAAIRDTINVWNQSFEATAEQYRKLLSVQLSERELRRYVTLVCELPEDESAWSTRARNKVDRMVSLAIGGTGSDGSRSVWNAYNGITEYETHERIKNDNNRTRSMWFGESAKTNQRALGLALQLAS